MEMGSAKCSALSETFHVTLQQPQKERETEGISSGGFFVSKI